MNTHEKEKIARILLDTGAVVVAAQKGEFVSDFSLIPSYPDERKIIVDAFVDYIENEGASIDVVVAANLPSIYFVARVADRLSLPMAYVRPGAKAHGKMKEIEGHLEEKSRVLFVNDVDSPENLGQVEHGIGVVKGRGASIARFVSILSYGLEEYRRLFKEAEIPHHSLTDLLSLSAITAGAGAGGRGHIDSPSKAKTRPGEGAGSPGPSLGTAEEMGIGTTERLCEIGAITVRRDNPFRYSSGILSPIYVDNRMLISFPREWGYVIDSFAAVVRERVGTSGIDCVAGIVTSGIAHAALLAERLGLPMIYVSPKEESTDLSIGGRLTGGERVVLVEDLITSGGSALSSAKKVRERGARVDICLAIFTYGFQRAKDAFRKEKIELITLSNLHTLLRFGEESGTIDERSRKEVIDWAADPDAYTQKRRGTGG